MARSGTRIAGRRWLAAAVLCLAAAAAQGAAPTPTAGAPPAPMPATTPTPAASAPAPSPAGACADPAGCTAGHVDTLAAIRARGVLRVGVAPSVPMVVRAHGTVEGFSIDVARRLAADIGVRVEFVPTTWERVVPDLVDGRTDVVIAGLWPTVDRAMRANFTTPTATEGIYLFASRRASGRTKSDFDRPDVRIATYPGTPQALAARRHFPRATHVDVKPDEKEFDLVAGGRADAAVVSTISAPGAVAGARRRVTLPFTDPLQSTPAAMAIRKGDPDFLNFLDTWLGIHRGEGWLDERAEYWAGEMEWFSDEAAPAGDAPR